VLIPRRALIASGPFGALEAERVAAAIARGLAAGGLPDPDVLALTNAAAGDVGELLLLLENDFDARMRAARAVIVAVGRLREQTLAGSVAFEIATRARQSGVPAYAITAENRMDAFDARILDLQAIVEADGPRALASAGRRLAKLV
jgi:glycerate kinase